MKTVCFPYEGFGCQLSSLDHCLSLFSNGAMSVGAGAYSILKPRESISEYIMNESDWCNILPKMIYPICVLVSSHYQNKTALFCTFVRPHQGRST